MTYLRLDHIDAGLLAAELYDPAKPGVAVLKDIIATPQLLKKIQEARQHFRHADRYEGKVEQHMDVLYQDRFTPELAECMTHVTKEYLKLHEKIGASAGFSEHINSIGIHYYPKGSLGITPHRDYAQDINLITILVAKGDAPFNTCRNREGEGSIAFAAPEGSCIFMRAARSPAEQELRPFHYLKAMGEERYTIILRTRLSM
jgi:hypothetical protein